MTIAIIDYGSGNLRSAQKAFERVASELSLKSEVMLTTNAADLAAADHIVLPGVGAFADCAAGLDALDGMTEALRESANWRKAVSGYLCGHAIAGHHRP